MGCTTKGSNLYGRTPTLYTSFAMNNLRDELPTLWTNPKTIFVVTQIFIHFLYLLLEKN